MPQVSQDVPSAPGGLRSQSPGISHSSTLSMKAANLSLRVLICSFSSRRSSCSSGSTATSSGARRLRLMVTAVIPPLAPGTHEGPPSPPEPPRSPP